MCGLAGIFDTIHTRPTDRDLLTSMTDSLAHRGPDGRGLHVANGIGLGHRRLAIIDVKGGDQPIYNEDGQAVIVFNGEIYNFQALAKQLEQLGHVFKSRSDTETILHAWEEWGPDCVNRLSGMFAFAIWDEKRQLLFLARDRLGKKPLYYSRLPDGRLVFGSELKALLACPDVARRIDPQAVETYLALGYVPDPDCIYRNIHKLPPAHHLIWRRGDLAPRLTRYWQVQLREEAASEEEIAEELIARLRRATESRMISEVPIGAFLSGGVDSSAVVAMMAGLSDRPVKTFSIAFDTPGFDESEYAAKVAALYGTDHSTDRVKAEDFGLLDRLAEIYDEPFGDSSALPTFQVCAAARRHVTVALSGDGGDEVFAGYRRYRLMQNTDSLRAALPGVLRRSLFGLLGDVYPKLDWAPRHFRAKTTFQQLALDLDEAYLTAVSVNRTAQRRAIMRARHGEDAIRVMRRRLRHDAPGLGWMQMADLNSWLPGDILTKVDRASMANSLEVRSPLLDHELIEWAFTLPRQSLIRQGQGKYIFKKALEPHLPRDVLYRPKQGFCVPVSDWLRGPLRDRLGALGGEQMGDCGLFDLAAIGGIAESHFSGRQDHGATLWTLLSFEAFLRRVHNGTAKINASAAA